MKKFIACAIFGISVMMTMANSDLASAVPATDKVVICHRTHSVTNPYVRITVAQSSVGNGSGKHGGNSHDQYSTTLFPGGKPTPNVFNLAVTYTPAPEKKWGDIISLLDVNGDPLTGNAALVAGLNNTGIGAQIFGNSAPYTTTCKSMTPRDLYEVEVIEGGQNPSDVLADLEELEADEFAAAKTACGGSFTGCSPATLGTPTGAAPTTTTTVAPTTTTTVAPTTTVAGATTTTVAGATTTTIAATRKLKGKLWVDTNRNGKKDANEKILASVTVTVTADSTNTSTQTYTVTTDASGNYEILDLPAGKWIVRAAEMSSEKYENVFDTDSKLASPDWVVTASVPSTGEAIADFAAAMTDVAVASGNELPATGSKDEIRMLWLAMLMVLVGAMIASRTRRRTA